MEKHEFKEGSRMGGRSCLKCGRPKAHEIHLVPRPTVSVPLKP